MSQLQGLTGAVKALAQDVSSKMESLGERIEALESGSAANRQPLNPTFNACTRGANRLLTTGGANSSFNTGGIKREHPPSSLGGKAPDRATRLR